MIPETPATSDEILARRTQDGSMEAFEELVLRYERRIYSFVAQSCRNRTDAAEITQDTFVKAYQAIHQFNAKRMFAPWLFTIARRKCVDHFRATRTTTQESPHELSDTNDPAELLAVEDERRQLWSVAHRILPRSQFDALWLHYIEDLRIADVASVLRRPQTYVKVLLFRARKALAEKLKRPRPNIATSPQSTAHAYEIYVR